ncbi:MAG: class I SAM-dependent methyltransferase [Deltaproteobacteria bacterium]|nr:class I SAM-dependent methyltransferase [Deltaproteobacteria bacterium]
MKLNGIEELLMNNPVRSGIQRFVETPTLRRLGGRVDGLQTLEVGCGRGVGTQLIFEQFGAQQVHAIDLDPDMVARAQRRLASYSADRLKLAVGDVTAIEAEDASFDAVFDFGIIHHVPDWPAAVAEVQRVLRPGGRFFFEEVTRHALERWSYRTFLDHPRHNRFSASEWVAEVERRGIRVGGNYVEWFFGDFVVGVGTKPAP